MYLQIRNMSPYSLYIITRAQVYQTNITEFIPIRVRISSNHHLIQCSTSKNIKGIKPIFNKTLRTTKMPCWSAHVSPHH